MAKPKRKKSKALKSPVPVPGGGEEIARATAVMEERQQVVTTLQGYLTEAKEARRSGLNPRDDKWSQNLDLYWSRYDFGQKAKWQAKEVLPEVPVFVDRFAAALKEALVATPGGFYSVVDPSDTEQDVAWAIKDMTDMWLSTSGRNQVGQVLPYSAVFEEQMKLGAIMAAGAVVTWKADTEHGRVAIENMDPRYLWLDHTNRNLYRIRRVELDRHELPSLVKMTDAKGEPIYNLDEISKMVSGMREEDQRWEQERTGAGTNVSSVRKPVVLDEFVATVLDAKGDILADRGLMVMANEQYLIRGPEKNPFMHGKDWVVFAPLVTAPLSPYGRSYMEDFGSIAKTFIELTNMILDAVHTSSLKAFAVVPDMLANPGQLADGISPNKVFQLEGGYRAEDFMKAIDLGTLSPDAYKVWQSIKSELREAASINEIGIGQFAPKGRTSATEINETQQSSSALIRSVAQTVETRLLDPTLDLVWKTGLQHLSEKDTVMKTAIGEPMFNALIVRRQELIRRPLTFQARGISTIIARGQLLKALIQIIGVIGQNDILMQAFLQKVDMDKLVTKLFELSNIDITMIQASEREKMIRSVTEPMNAAMERGQGAPGASDHTQRQMGDVTKMLGVGR